MISEIETLTTRVKDLEDCLHHVNDWLSNYLQANDVSLDSVEEDASLYRYVNDLVFRVDSETEEEVEP